MPIKIEILADSPGDLMHQLRGLLAGDPAGSPSTSPVEEVTLPPPPPLPAAKAKPAPAKKPPAKAKSKVKPLPADEDPLASTSPVEEEAEQEAPQEEDPFAGTNGAQAGQSPADMIKTATGKLRDVFSRPKGSPGVLALKEKYSVKFFHDVPQARAQEFLADALRLEQETAS
jgi:hypothetical protein